MKRFFMGLLAFAGIALTQKAQAQYGPGFRGPGFFMPQYYSARSVFIGGVHPLIGAYNYRYDTFYYNVRPVIYAPVYGYGTPYSPGSVTGSAGGLGGDPILAKQMDALRKAQKAAAGVDDPLLKKTVFDAWATERGAAKAEELLKTKHEALRKALTSPATEDVLAGASSNIILANLKEFEGKTPRVASAFLPPEVLDMVRFDGGPAADALNTIRAGRISFPLPLQSAEFDKVRNSICHDYASFAHSLNNGKKFEVYSLEQIAVNAKKLRKQAESLTGDDAKTAKAFLDRMDAAVKAMQSPAHNGLVVPEWATVGVSVHDLVKHMKTHKLTFGAGTADDEIAYSALHRALSAYYLSFLGPK